MDADSRGVLYSFSSELCNCIQCNVTTNKCPIAGTSEIDQVVKKCFIINPYKSPMNFPLSSTILFVAASVNRTG